ncbi:hypothetical protein V6N12_044023 [Hibiscus sabdariffa]|uniref:Uncharacterized protein n=1 Tax=Hibiscus sabdariffa TaxID=183260 RepID=A0ABR2DGH0_9ROSI
MEAAQWTSHLASRAYPLPPSISVIWTSKSSLLLQLSPCEPNYTCMHTSIHTRIYPSSSRDETMYRGVGSGGGSQTSGNCEVRGLGVVDRNARSKSEHMDVMRCVQLDMVQESPELHTAPILCEAGGESPVAMLELE